MDKKELKERLKSIGIEVDIEDSWIDIGRLHDNGTMGVTYDGHFQINKEMFEMKTSYGKQKHQKTRFVGENSSLERLHERRLKQVLGWDEFPSTFAMKQEWESMDISNKSIMVFCGTAIKDEWRLLEITGKATAYCYDFHQPGKLTNDHYILIETEDGWFAIQNEPYECDDVEECLGGYTEEELKVKHPKEYAGYLSYKDAIKKYNPDHIVLHN